MALYCTLFISNVNNITQQQYWAQLNGIANSCKVLVWIDLRLQGRGFLFDQPEEGEDFRFAFSSKSPQTTKDDAREEFQFPFNFWVCKSYLKCRINV